MSKRHVTVTITEKLIRELNPCRDGFNALKHLLPAKLSTNPDDNIDLALEIAQSDRACCYHDDSWWLAARFRQYDGLPDTDTGGLFYKDMQDPTIIAQRLAMVADALASKDGR